MKQLYLKCLLLSILSLAGIKAQAYDCQVDGIYYNLDTSLKYAHVTFYNRWLSSSYTGSVTIPSSITYNGTSYSVTRIEAHAFHDCSGLTSVIIPNSVKEIDHEAFEYCSGLTSVTIPESVNYIGYHAFYGCSGLTSVTIPESVTYIDESPFAGCSSIKTIKVENGNTIYDSRNDCNAIIRTADNELIVGCSNTIIPNSVTSIGDGAFQYCSGLTSVTIPESVNYIGYHAFYGCSGLTSVTIPESVTDIGNYAFCGCSGLTSVTIGNSVTYIGDSAFENCSGLTSVAIPNSVDSIRWYAFAYCSSLTSVTIGNSVTSIGDFAFCHCSGLTSVVIGNSVTSIGDLAFCGCSNLTSVTIPNSVTSIGFHAFLDCSSLTSVTSLIEEPFAIGGNSVFYGCNNATLYVPVGTKSKYETTDGWKNFKNIVEMELLPVDNGQTIDFSTDIDENTNLNGSIMDNVFVNVNNGDGSYDPSEGCIIVSKPTDDSAIDGKEIFGEDFKDNYTGIVFKLAPGEGTIKVEAQTTGNMVLKVKIGDSMPITMELEGKLKVSFPYNVSEDTYVYIYGGLNTSNNAKGMRKAEPADGTLKIYGIEVDSKANDIESLEVSQDDIATIYNLNGHRINSLQRGVNIIRMNDGTVRKVVVK